MKVYRICIDSYGGPLGYCSSELLYTKWYSEIEEAISAAYKIERPSFERRVKFFLQNKNVNIMRSIKNNNMESREIVL